MSSETLILLGRFLGAGLALGLGGIGAAIGMGMAAAAANEGMMRQPRYQGYILRTMLIGQAVGGSPSIFALVIGLIILFVPESTTLSPEIFSAALVGAGLSIGLGCFGSGWGCGWPGAAGCQGVARNPRRTTPVTSMMIVGQAVAQSPSIFATVVALILIFVELPGAEWAALGIMIGSGLAMGAGALGPGIGSGATAGGAMEGIGRWPLTQGATVRTMLITQAVSQTPAIFAMLVAFIMMFAMQEIEADVIGFAKLLGAAIAVGFGGIGPGIGSGLAGDAACYATAARPRVDALMLRTVLIGQAVSQSTAIYALIIALVLLYVV